MYATGIGYGPLIYFGNSRKKNENIIKCSILLPIINTLTSILASLVLFTFMGNIS